MEDSKLISSELKEFFASKNMQQQEIANLLGVTQQAVSALLTGSRPFGKKNAKKWGKLFGINPIWLLTGEGDMLISNNSASSGGVVIHKGSIEGIAHNIGGHNNTSNINNSDLLLEIERLKEENSSLKDKIIELQSKLIEK